MSGLRVLVVDDNGAEREGRKAWLLNPNAFGSHRDITVASCVASKFEDALALTPEQWHQIDLLIVDAFDTRSLEKRELEAKRAGVRDDIWDFTPGRRVVESAASSGSKTRIIVVSGIVTVSPVVSRMMSGAGAHFVLDKADVDDAEDFCEQIANLWETRTSTRVPKKDIDMAAMLRDLHKQGVPGAMSAFGPSRAPRRTRDRVRAKAAEVLDVQQQPSGPRKTYAQHLYRKAQEAVGWNLRPEKQ